uniref:Transposase IS4-like domain-containing protein n=1 Tax=Rhodnius prolixus TaxID=13249 RepID=T1I8J6_RHOPR
MSLCYIYVRSERAGKRVKESITHWLEKRLKLKVNERKSAVSPPCELVVRLTDTHGKFIGRWTLLTNVSNEITSAEVARWYYWRWGIESFFKLLKGAGHDVEKWLQRSAGALLRRLLIASMACMLVWRLQRAEGDDNTAARQLICRLSGRQQKRGRKESAPALLAGLSILLNTLTLLADYTPEELAHFAMVVFNPL